MDERPRDHERSGPEVTRHREGEHVAGRPETRDETDVEPGTSGPGLEGIPALPEDDEDDGPSG
jgi:hypothetical protein